MSRLYSDADKVYTDSSMLDEIVHNLKLILQGIILKDQQEAEDNETAESIANSDLYMAITDGTVTFSEFLYDGKMLRRMNQYIIDNGIELDPFTDEQIEEYTIDNDAIPKAYRPILISIASTDFLDSYVELNNYYRRLNGQKDIGDADFYVDISYIPSTYYQQFIPAEVLAAYDRTGKTPSQIKSDMRKMAEDYLLSTPITDFTTYQISLMDTVGIMDNILDENPSVLYLRFLGAKKVSIYKARKAERYEILYLPDCESQIRKRFNDIFDRIRAMYLKRYYSQAYKFENEYYDKFFAIFLICQTANDVMVEMPEYFISRTVFDARTVQTILEANGVKYFSQIPLKYQIALVRSLTGLIKYKSTTKNIFDIAKNVFNLKNIEVSKYYLLKKRNISPDETLPFDMNGGPAGDSHYDKEHEMDGGWPGTGENGETLIVYDGGTASKSVEFLTSADLNKMYSLFFVRVPIGDTLDNYLRNTVYHTPYDSITNIDPYWDGPYDHEYVKYEILKKDFTTQSTKYLSLTSGYSSNDYIFQIVYFLNMIMNTPVDSKYLNMEIPVINQTATFNIHDLIILLYCLSFQYFDPTTDDIILLHNRDPKSTTNVDPTVVVGDYDPEALNDWDMNGGPPAQQEEYYLADGGYSLNSRIKYININGWWPTVPTVLIDFPETMAIEFDEAATDSDFDGLRPFEFLEVEQMDGGYPNSVVTDRDLVYDGGYVKNSYLFHGEDTGLLEDPCQFYREPAFDKFNYPTIDLSNRILGFNMEAGMGELQSYLDQVRVARFQYIRGYKVNEILPSYTQKINMYEGKSLFPQVGITGQLYEDTTNGKFYFWNSNGYTQIATVYSKGIQDFMVPENGTYYTPNELTTIYKNNKEIYNNLVNAIRDCDSEEDLWILTFVYEYLFTMRWDLSYYKLPSTGKIATRYSEFLKEKDGILYSFYEKLISETNIETKQYNMSTYLDQVIESIQQYLSSDGLEYIFYFVPTVSLGVTLRYVSMLLNFFKSYKAYILDVSSTMRFESTVDNIMTQKDGIGYMGHFYDKDDPLLLYDYGEINMSFEKNDSAIKDNQEDRLFMKEEFLRRWVDLNGGYVDQNYWFDIDANANSGLPGYPWPYDRYYVLEGGGPEDACPKEDEWAPLHSPHFTGIPTAPTPPKGTNNNIIATTEFVHDFFDWNPI